MVSLSVVGNDLLDKPPVDERIRAAGLEGEAGPEPRPELEVEIERLGLLIGILPEEASMEGAGKLIGRTEEVGEVFWLKLADVGLPLPFDFDIELAGFEFDSEVSKVILGLGLGLGLELGLDWLLLLLARKA